MSKDTAVNTILLPIIGAVASATLTLLLKEVWVMGIIGAVITFGLAYLYEILP
jgi:hypothetical protein